MDNDELDDGESHAKAVKSEEVPPLKVSIVPEPVKEVKEEILDDYIPDELTITKEMKEDEDFE